MDYSKDAQLTDVAVFDNSILLQVGVDIFSLDRLQKKLFLAYSMGNLVDFDFTEVRQLIYIPYRYYRRCPEKIEALPTIDVCLIEQLILEQHEG